MIANGIERAINSEIAQHLVKNEKKYIKETSWGVSAEKFYNLYTKILNEKSEVV